MRCTMLLLGIALGTHEMVQAQPGELIERTLVIVGGQAITLSDVRTASALQLIEANPDRDLEAAVSRLVDRLLMLREVQRYAPAEPDARAEPHRPRRRARDTNRSSRPGSRCSMRTR